MDPTENDAFPGADAGDTTSTASTDTDSRRSRQHRTPIADLVDPFLRDKGKGDAGESGNYRSDAARELDRFVEWLREEDLGRDPTFDDLDETTDLARNRPNVVSTDLALLSVWRNERLLEAATDCEDGNPGLSNDETDRCGKYSMRVTRSTPVNRRTAIS